MRGGKPGKTGVWLCAALFCFVLIEAFGIWAAILGLACCGLALLSGGGHLQEGSKVEWHYANSDGRWQECGEETPEQREIVRLQNQIEDLRLLVEQRREALEEAEDELGYCEQELDDLLAG